MKARLYSTACGIYEVLLNGGKAGDQCFAPGFTDYRKRLQYQTFNVTSQIKPGQNVIEIDLADGWFRGSLGALGVYAFLRPGNKAALPAGADLC